MKIVLISLTPWQGVRNFLGPQVILEEHQWKRNPFAVISFPHMKKTGKWIIKPLRHPTNKANIGSDEGDEREIRLGLQVAHSLLACPQSTSWREHRMISLKEFKL